MPNRGSQNVHDNDYRWLVELYGERCLLCGALPEKGLRFQVDHINTDPAVYDLPSNKSLLCPSCNNRLRDVDALDAQRPQQHRQIIESARLYRLEDIARERAKSLKQAKGSADSKLLRAYRNAVKKTQDPAPPLDDSFKNDVLDYNSGSPEQRANVRYYKQFDIIVRQVLLQRRGAVPEKELLNIGSLKTHASQTTLKRYMDGWCADDKDAPFLRIDDGGEWKIFFRKPHGWGKE